MKNVKNVMSALAIVFAIGAVFAFSPPNNAEMSTVQAHAEGECSTVYNIPEQCQLASALPVICKIDPFTNAIRLNTCAQPQVFTRNP